MRSLVVLVDHRSRTVQRVGAAASLAREGHARLTLLAPIGVPSPFSWCTPVTTGETPGQLQDEIERECGRLLQQLEATVPTDIGVTLQGRRGGPRRVLREEIAAVGHDVVVLDPPAPGLLGWIKQIRDRRLTCGLDVSVLRVPNGGRGRPAPPPHGLDLTEGTWPAAIRPRR